MTQTLKQYFPMIQSREELMKKIHQSTFLTKQFNSWEPSRQEEFLDFCTGVRGIKILYDVFFKEVMNPEYDKERLEDFLSILLRRKVSILSILPNDSTRISDESSLLITDIIVELEDGSIANVEIQKIGYKFPAQRSACYSSDMMLRQYKRTRSRHKNNFSYGYVKNVYLIVIYEKSPSELRNLTDSYLHFGDTVFDTGLRLDMPQKYIMIALDNFKKCMENKDVETELEAWLTFLSEDNPERIAALIEKFPKFKPMYETLYLMCREVEKTMGFFSEELRIMDRNTVKLMIEEMQDELEAKDETIETMQDTLKTRDETIKTQNLEIQSLKRKLELLRTK